MSLSNIKYFGNLSLFFAGSSISGVSPITFLSVIVCTLPFSDIVMYDSKSKFLLFESTRINKIKYINYMIIVAGISGALALFLPYVVLLIINILFLGTSNINVGAGPGIFSGIYLKSQLLYSLLIIIGYSCFGFVYSIMGMASSIMFKRKIMALVVPFVYYLGGGLTFGILGWSRFEPVGTFDLRYQSQNTIVEVFIQLFLILLFSVFVIMYYVSRKFEDYT